MIWIKFRDVLTDGTRFTEIDRFKIRDDEHWKEVSLKVYLLILRSNVRLSTRVERNDVFDVSGWILFNLFPIPFGK